MKTQKKNLGLHVHKTNNRWKWMAGATAAGVSVSQASTITINLVNNFISATGGNHLNADLTGDGHPDLTLANAFYRVHYFTSRPRGLYYPATFDAGVILNGVGARAHDHESAVPNFGSEVLGSRIGHFSIRTWNFRYPSLQGTFSLTGSIPLFFKDLHINGGAPTMGSLQVTVFGRLPNIQLDSFTYNSNTPTSAQPSSLTVPAQTSSHTVPDQGSSLALLAMGAGGVLAFRRWRRAKVRA
jgi:hypothetical protein